MPQRFRWFRSILLVGAVVTVFSGCAGGGEDADPPVPAMTAVPDAEKRQEVEIELDTSMPVLDMPSMPIVDDHEEVETAPEPSVPVSDMADMPTMDVAEGTEEAEVEAELPAPMPDTAEMPVMNVAEGNEEAEVETESPVSMLDEPVTPLMEATEEPEAEPPPVDPPSPALHLDAAPVVAYRGRLHVGADVTPDAGLLASAGMHDATAVSYGRLRDGVGAREVIAYLRQHAEVGEFKLDSGLLTFPAPPTVRLAEGTTNEMADFLAQAVRLLNAYLPQDRRIRFGSERVTPLEPLADVPDGDIFVDFAPWKDWNDPYKPPEASAVALAQWAWQTVVDAETRERLEIGMRAGRIWVDRDAIMTAWVLDSASGQWEETVLSRRVDDHDGLEKWYPDQAVVAILAHELLHTLGMGVHLDPDRFPSSILNEDRHDYDGVTGHVLFPLDREALQAAYSVLEPGALPEQLVDDLGAWEDTSLHLRGEIDTPRGGAFGVAVRNGLAQPWADGRMPHTDLVDNRRLSGTVSWAGRLLGFTPALQAVGGAADLSVRLGTLAGQLDFTGLEHWTANAAPGPVGSGTLWGDGDLQYLLSVRGNTFTQTGGDAGAVTGSFFGHDHGAMGGVLERSDLVAAFGGTR